MMKKQLTVVVAVGGLLLGALAIAQTGGWGGMGQGMGGPGMMGQGSGGGSVLRHRYVMTKGIDPQYAKAHNPLTASDLTLREGKVLYENNCVTCHGTSGRGDGPASRGMNPAPADLTAAIRLPIASDAYLDWTISEGGIPVQSAMPPYKTALSNDEIWKVVLYLRTL
jgi:mono/diheme cytochrome c family protein